MTSKPQQQSSPLNDNPLRVFVYSMLSDPQAERDTLLHHILPELRRGSLERGLLEPEIDLRWGGVETSAYFDDIVRHRPLFIGILGPSTGWISPLAGNEADVKQFPWLEDAVNRLNNRVETGIIERVLNDPLMYDQAYFYIREGLHAVAPRKPANEGMARLGERIRKRSTSRTYHDPESFRALVREDLMAALDRIRPAAGSPSALDRERHAHYAFAAEHIRAYVKRSRDIRRLDAHAAGNGPPLLVTGTSGAGKSALLAYWSDRYGQKHTGDFIITHYVEAGSSGMDHGAVLRRIMGEIRERYKLTSDLPTGEEELVQALPEWLASVQGERLVLVIDGINRLNEHSRNLDWLPRSFQPNIRLIVSTLDTAVPGELQTRKWSRLPVTPLSIAGRRQVIGKILEQLGGRLSTKGREALSTGPLSALPLSLRLVLAQLGIYGAGEEEVITSYLATDDLGEFYQRVLDGLERGPGGGHLCDVLSLLWGSRAGLSETELQTLTGTKPADLSPLILALDPHLIRQQGRVTFFHDSLRQAVEARYSIHNGTERKIHAKLARYFANLPISERRADEEPWQLYMAGKRIDLMNCVTSYDMFMALSSEERKYDLVRYWKYINVGDSIVEAYLVTLDRTASRTSDALNASFLHRLGSRLYDADLFRAAIIALRRSVEFAAKVPRNGAVVTEISILLGIALQAIKEDEEAESLLIAAVEFYERNTGQPEEKRADAHARLGTFYYSRQHYDKAEPALSCAIESYQRTYGAGHITTLETLLTLGAVMLGEGRFDQAEQIAATVLETCRRLHGNNHIVVARALNNLAAAYDQQGRYADALELVQQALEIDRAIYGPHHSEIAAKLNNLAMLTKKNGDAAAARLYFRQAISAANTIFGTENLMAASFMNNLAALYRNIRSYRRAEGVYRQSLAIREDQLGQDNILTVNTQLNLAGVLLLQRRVDEAVTLYRPALRRKLRLSRSEHPEWLRARANFITQLSQQGHAALAYQILSEIESI